MLVVPSETNKKSDVAAKAAFIAELRSRGISASVTAAPADVTAVVNGVPHYYEVKYTRRLDSYFGAATLTEWEAAIAHEDRYWFVVAFQREGQWVFHEYTPAEFMAFSSIPPFKVFFQIPVGVNKAPAPLGGTRSVRMTRERLVAMSGLFHAFRAESGHHVPEPRIPATQPRSSLQAAHRDSPAKGPSGGASAGSRVTIRDHGGEVSSFILSVDGGPGRVSIGSPLGKAIVGRHAGESVLVEAPAGPIKYELLSVVL